MIKIYKGKKSENKFLPIEYNSADEDTYCFDFPFTIFSSINGHLIIIYIAKKKSFSIFSKKNILVSYDLINKKIITVNARAHLDNIDLLDYFFDKVKSRDLISSLSSIEKNLKIWDIKDWSCIFNVKNLYQKGYIISSFININNEILIATANNYLYGLSEPIKFYNFNEKCVKKLSDKSKPRIISMHFCTICFNGHYNDYITINNSYFFESYNYANNVIFHKYLESNCPNNLPIDNFIINENKLISFWEDSFYRVFNFSSGKLIHKFFGVLISEISLLFKEFLLCTDYYGILNLDNKIFEEKYKDKFYLKKFRHPLHGLCNVAKGKKKILIWVENE